MAGVDIVSTLVTLVSLTQLIDLLECLCLLILLSIQTTMHIQVRYLLFSVYRHVFRLFYGDLLVYFKH